MSPAAHRLLLRLYQAVLNRTLAARHAAWSVRLAPWALSVMAPGGRAIFPQEPYRAHTDCLDPARRREGLDKGKER